MSQWLLVVRKEKWFESRVLNTIAPAAANIAAALGLEKDVLDNVMNNLAWEHAGFLFPHTTKPVRASWGNAECGFELIRITE